MKINNKIEDDINYLKLLDILEEKKKTKGECKIKLNNNHEINFLITLSSKEFPSNSKNDSFRHKIEIFSSKNNSSVKKSMPIETNQKEVHTTNFNIIYLIDTTLSMKKYENFIYFLPNINSFQYK